MNNMHMNQIITIMGLIYNINETMEYSAFINFSGHVNSLSIQVAESKENYDNLIFNKYIYIENSERTTLELNHIIEILRKIQEGTYE